MHGLYVCTGVIGDEHARNERALQEYSEYHQARGDYNSNNDSHNSSSGGPPQPPQRLRPRHKTSSGSRLIQSSLDDPLDAIQSGGLAMAIEKVNRPNKP